MPVRYPGKRRALGIPTDRLLKLPLDKLLKIAVDREYIHGIDLLGQKNYASASSRELPKDPRNFVGAHITRNAVTERGAGSRRLQGDRHRESRVDEMSLPESESDKRPLRERHRDSSHMDEMDVPESKLVQESESESLWEACQQPLLAHEPLDDARWLLQHRDATALRPQVAAQSKGDTHAHHNVRGGVRKAHHGGELRPQVAAQSKGSATARVRHSEELQQQDKLMARKLRQKKPCGRDVAVGSSSTVARGGTSACNVQGSSRRSEPEASAAHAHAICVHPTKTAEPQQQQQQQQQQQLAKVDVRMTAYEDDTGGLWEDMQE